MSRENEAVRNDGTGANGSVWWTEFSMGILCLLLVGLYALSHTRIGPFASLTVRYDPVVTVSLSAVTLVVGGLFVRSGLRSLRGE